MLTGQPDTDTRILLSLDLQEVRQFCQMNRYASNLCQNRSEIVNKLKLSRKKVESFINLVDHLKKPCILQPYSSVFKPFVDIFRLIEEIHEGYYVLQILNKELSFIDIISHNINKDDDTRYIIYFFEEIEHNDGTAYKYFVDLFFNKKQLEEYLLHLFYNQLVITF